MTQPSHTSLIWLLSLFSREKETPERPDDWPENCKSFAQPMKEPLSAFERRTFGIVSRDLPL